MTHHVIPASQTGNVSPFEDWKEKPVQDITLLQLKASHPENGSDNEPLKGIYHHELIEHTLEVADRLGYKPRIGDLFAAQNADRATPGVSILPREEREYGVGSPQSQILRRVYCNINLPIFDDGVGEERNTGNIALSYHQGGIQAGFGPHVYICHNQTMLGYNQMISTIGQSNRSSRGDGRQGGATVQEVLTQIDNWLEQAPEILAANRRRMEYMKNVEIPHEQWLFLLGFLNDLRIKHDSRNATLRQMAPATYPLSSAQLNVVGHQVALLYATKADPVTLWDIYNAATEVYKPAQIEGREIEIPKMDIANILPQNEAFVEELNKQYAFLYV